jgi:hypothetical protein
MMEEWVVKKRSSIRSSIAGAELPPEIVFWSICPRIFMVLYHP